MGHEDVENAVASNVPEGDSHIGLGLPQAVEGEAPYDRFFLESPILLVDPQVVRLAIVGDKNVGPAVAVEVGADHAESRTGALSEPRAQGHIGETNSERGARSAERGFLRSALRA